MLFNRSIIEIELLYSNRAHCFPTLFSLIFDAHANKSRALFHTSGRISFESPTPTSGIYTVLSANMSTQCIWGNIIDRLLLFDCAVIIHLSLESTERHNHGTALQLITTTYIQHNNEEKRLAQSS